MPYPVLPSKPSKRYRKPRGRPTRKGSLVARSVILPGKYTTIYQDGSQTTGSKQARYLETVTSSGMNPGNFKDPTAWSYDCKKLWSWNGLYKSSYGANYFYERGTLADTGDFSNSTGVGLASGVNQSRADIAYNLALSRLNEKVRGGLDLGLSLVEAGATGKMLRSLANVRKYLHDARSGNINPFGGGVSDLANGWLQFQYGWRPLLSDAFASADESLRIVLNKIENVSGSAKVPATGQYRGTATIRNIPNVPYLQDTSVGFAACRIHMRYDVGARFDLARWSSLNPISLGWEVIPYSFVVDWFVDVSSYLRNAETALLYGARFHSGYVSELFVQNTTAKVDYYSTVIAGSKYEFFATESHGERRIFRRSVLSSYPFPRTPSFKVALGWQRYLSAAALISQFFTGR